MSINLEKLDKPFTRTCDSRGNSSPRVTGFYEPDTGSCQYICVDPATGKAALIDIVQDFDPASATTYHDTAQAILDLVEREKLSVEWVLDTHPHADHFTASTWLKEKTGAKNAIGERVREIAGLWEDLYHLPDAFDPGADYDRLFADGDTFRLGDLECRVMLSPGHTLGSITYLVGDDCAFVHDTFMHVDAGTARADFPGGSSAELYDSLQAILALPDETRLFVGHDYGTDERHEPAWEATVAAQARKNIHVGGGVGKEEYVKLRDERDATLGLPDRMLFGLQINLRAGKLPPDEADGQSYFKIPANRL